MAFGLPLSEQNLILTGYTQPNKPRLAQQIAAQLKMPLVDVNQRIETRMGDDPEAIRSLYGDRRLRTVEAEIMDEVLLHRSAVIRIEGSTLLHSNHYKRLRGTGQVICLIAQLGALLRQMHLAMGARYHNPQERAAGLGELQREWRIRQLPGVHLLDTTYQSDQAVLDAVLALWAQVSLQRG